MSTLLINAAFTKYQIEFPALNWEITVTKEAFSIFGFNIYWYAIFISLGFILSIIFGLRCCTKYGLSQENLLDILIFTAPFALLCARIYYVVFSWEKYQGNLKAIFNFREGGLAIYGGLIGAFLMVYIVGTKVKKLSFLRNLDFAAPYIAMAQSIGRWGNFVNQEAFGVNTKLPWGMTSELIQKTLTESAAKLDYFGITVDPALPVHPTFFYESAMNFILFLILLYCRKTGVNGKKGRTFFLYLSGYGLIRFFVEGLRIDSLMIGYSSIRVSQLLAIVCFLVFGALFIYTLIPKKDILKSVTAGQSEYGELLRSMEEERKESRKANAVAAGDKEHKEGISKNNDSQDKETLNKESENKKSDNNKSEK